MSNQALQVFCRISTANDVAAQMQWLHQNAFANANTAAWFYHHTNQVFLALDENGEINGMLIVWKSGVAYNTAVIDQLYITADEEEKEIVAAALILQSGAELQHRCIRYVQVSTEAAATMSDKFWEAQGFDISDVPATSRKKILMPLRICLDGKKMKPNLNTQGGQVSEDTTFEYLQDGDYVWGTYYGGEVKRGVLVGKMTASRDINFFYMQLDADGGFHQGTSRSNTEYLNDGRLVLYEDWVWTGDKKGEGNAVIEEIKE